MSIRSLRREPLVILLIVALCLSTSGGEAAADGGGGEGASAAKGSPGGAPREKSPPPVRFEKLSGSCYVGIQPGGESNAGFVVGKDSVLVVDCFGSSSRGAELLLEVKRVTDKPVSHVALTHWHYDHTVGNQALPKGVKILAARESGMTLRKRLDSDRLLLSPASGMHGSVGIEKVKNATELLEVEKKIDLGGIEVRIVPAGECHSSGDLVVYVPSEKVLFAGDLVWSGLHPNISSGSTFRWIAALAGLTRLELEKVVPGHGEPGDKDLLSTQRRYLMSVRRMVKHLAKNEVLAKDIFEKLKMPEGYAKLGFAAFWASNVKYVYGELHRGR